MEVPSGSAVKHILRRVSALLCLAGLYELATGGIDPKWLGIVTVSALVVVPAPSFWTLAPRAPQSLRWLGRLLRSRWFIPGCVMMLTAAAAKCSDLSPRLVIWVWFAGVLLALAGAWGVSRRTSAVSGLPTRHSD